MVNSETVSRRLGKNSIPLIGKLANSGINNSILEFIVNSYDNDATSVSINFNPETNSMTIIDNGDGMDLKGLETFYTVGDSIKKSEKKSNRGRTRIGEFGVGTTQLGTLTRAYKMSTRQGGIERIIDETIGNEGVQEKNLDISSKKLKNQNEHGTTLHLYDLKFTEGENFTLKKLIEDIKWKLPLMDDFKIKVNGKEIEPKSIESGRKFHFQKNGNYMGEVEGNFYLTGKSSAQAGIHVYVNGRRVGDPKTVIDLSSIKASLKSRVVGIINANGLEEGILMDRDRFREEDLSYKEFISSLKNEINKIYRFMENENKKSKKNKTLLKRPMLLKKVKKKLTSLDLDEISSETIIEFQELENPEIIGTLNLNQDMITLNSTYSPLQITETTDNKTYENQILHSLITLLAYERANSLNSKEEQFKSFFEFNSYIWSLVNKNKPNENSSGTNRNIFENAFYSIPEISNISQRSLREIRYFLNGGLFPFGNQDEILGSDYLSLNTSIKSLTSLEEITSRSIPNKNNIGFHFSRLSTLFSDLDLNQFNERITNIGINGTAVYMVNESSTPNIIQMLINGDKRLNKNNKDYNPTKAFLENI